MFLTGQDGRTINLLQIGVINIGEDPKTVMFYDKNNVMMYTEYYETEQEAMDRFLYIKEEKCMSV